MWVQTPTDKVFGRLGVFHQQIPHTIWVLQRSELSRQGLLSAERYGEVLKTQVRGGGTPQESVVTGDSVITLRTHKKYKMLLLPLENRLWKAKDYNTVSFCYYLLWFFGREVLHLSIYSFDVVVDVCYKIMKAPKCCLPGIKNHVLVMI